MFVFIVAVFPQVLFFSIEIPPIVQRGQEGLDGTTILGITRDLLWSVRLIWSILERSDSVERSDRVFRPQEWAIDGTS